MVLKRLNFFLFHNIIDLFFPERCPGCERYTKPEKYCFCSDCLTQIIPAPLSNEKILSLAIYEGPVKQAIHNLKYRKIKWIAFAFAVWMNDFLQKHNGIEFDLIIPVPLHPIKEFQRSFNQSWLIAYHLGKMQRKQTEYAAIVKIKNNRSQTELDNTKRKENVKGVYKVKRASLIENKNILIIDDVYTTGATVEEISKTLIKAGAAKTTVLTVART